MSDARTLADIRTFPQLITYLREELDWPIEGSDFEEMTFEYTAEELGIDSRNAAKIEDIKRLRPLVAHQPWGIFFVKFAPGRLPVVALRRVLNAVVLKKRATANAAERAVWETEDLLFVSNYGEGEQRQITFAHFAQGSDHSAPPTLNVLGWDNLDTALHIDHVAATLNSKLRWPQNARDTESWREAWRSAFTVRHKEVITTSKALALRLAELARALRDRTNGVLAIETPEGPVTKIMAAFRTALVHDLDADGFADMYAQTIAYGLLSARIARPAGRHSHHPGPIVVTNPFLKALMEAFLHVGKQPSTDVGGTFDELGVAEVVGLLDDANIEAVVRDFGDRNPDEDPVIHFYELFLKEYDPAKRMQRGVFYTPRPVVSHIVRSVDELLRTECGLPDGLADTATWAEVAERDTRVVLPDGVHAEEPFVQILDPAAGTGTFLVEVIDLIHKRMVEKWYAAGGTQEEIGDLWDAYVDKHLLPRLHGFELLMAPYAIAHLKVGLKLAETGYRFSGGARVQVYLTNSLEAPQDFSGHLPFSVPALANEAQAVSEIKKNRRFTVVLGNPPYANFGRQNRNPHILRLLADYKAGLKEKKLNLDDDYIKFLRLGHHFITQSGAGCLAMITNSSYLDGLVHRRMRELLLRDFAVRHVLNLHGSSRREGSRADTDENVFDIQQGVAIGVFTRRPAEVDDDVVHYADLRGPRDAKYSALLASNIRSIPFVRRQAFGPKFFLVPQDDTMVSEYEAAFPLNEAFELFGSGLNTDRDSLFIDFDADPLESRIRRLLSGDFDHDFRSTYNVFPSSSYDPEALAKRQTFDPDAMRRCIYRPFDFRHIYYKVGLTSRPVFDVQGHMLHPNVGLLFCRQTKEPFAVLATRYLSTHKIVAVYDRTSLAPLWRYPITTGDQETFDFETSRLSNLAPTFMARVAAAIAPPNGDVVDLRPEAVFDYIYGVFYSPTYRARYAELLKADYPRVPLPASLEVFLELSRLGASLRALHLLEAVPMHRAPQYLGGAEPIVGRVSWKDDCVWLDSKAGVSGARFVGVPDAVWDFHVGGYRVCEKWLRDRRDRRLTSEEIAHYRQVVASVSETLRLASDIDDVIDRLGGWATAFALHGSDQVPEPWR